MTTPPPAQELPELPKNVQHIMRRIRACEGEEAARIVLEHALREYGRACIAASQAGRAAVPTPIKETDARDKDLDARRYDVLRTCRGMEHDPLFAVYDDEGHVLWGGDLDHAIDEAIIYAQDIYGDIPATPPLEVRESAKCGYCGGSGSVNSWTTATSSDICFKCNGAGTATAKGE